MTARRPLFVGVDGGGTSCRVAIADVDGMVIASAIGGSANIFTDLDGGVGRIRQTILLAAQQAGLTMQEVSTLPTALGLAGVNIGVDLERLETLLGLQHAQIVTDAEIALEGALGSGDGIVAIVGTGSVYLRRVLGETTGIGGWGSVLGDQASGARLGRDCLEQTLLAHDGIVAPSKLTDALLAKFDHDPMTIVRFAGSAQPGDFAKFAGDVFAHAEQGDPLASAILIKAVQDIERAVSRLQTASLPFVMLGGLSDLYRRHLSEKLTANLREAKGSPLDGALSIARKMAQPQFAPGRLPSGTRK